MSLHGSHETFPEHPLVSAAMDTVTESVMAIAMAEKAVSASFTGTCLRTTRLPRSGLSQAEDLIEREVVAVGPDATVTDVEVVMRRYGVGGVPVIDDSKVIGIVSRRDISDPSQAG